VPCFLWIFAFGPFVEALTSRPRLTAALSGIKAAVVGVIANLGFWFALHFFFTGLSPLGLGFANPLWPDATTLDARAVLAAALAAAMLFGLRWSVLAVVIASAGAGAVISAVALP
jgi:chromate transporter